MESKPKVTQNGSLEFQLIKHLQQETINLKGNDRTKESSFKLPGATMCGKETNGVRFVCRFLCSGSSSRIGILPLGRNGGNFSVFAAF